MTHVLHFGEIQMCDTTLNPDLHLSLSLLLEILSGKNHALLSTLH